MRLVEDVQELDLLLDSCRSEFTKNQYACFMEKYIKFVGNNDIFCRNNPRLIEAKIIEYINLLKKEEIYTHKQMEKFQSISIRLSKKDDQTTRKIICIS